MWQVVKHVAEDGSQMQRPRLSELQASDVTYAISQRVKHVAVDTALFDPAGVTHWQTDEDEQLPALTFKPQFWPQVRLVPSHWQLASEEQFVLDVYLNAQVRPHDAPPVDHEHMGFWEHDVAPPARRQSSRQTLLVESHWQPASFAHEPSLL